MGEAKRKQLDRQKILAQHPWCIYCGGAATTTDHCPPRCFFVARAWPETYEFPACSPCNDEARLDEQALAVMIRSGVAQIKSQSDQDEWNRLLKGVHNNQPAMVAEWLSLGASERKRRFRELFGDAGDRMRHLGWGALHIGPLSSAALTRFMVKLGKALYFRHNQTVLDGVIYADHINLLDRDRTPEVMQHILREAPQLSESRRANQSLQDQFVYRFNHSSEHGVMYAIVQFNEQYIFQLVVVGWEMEATLAEAARAASVEGRVPNRYPCPIKFPHPLQHRAKSR
jgi:hypothetical protein